MRKLFVCFLKKSFVLELFFSEYNDKKRKKMLYKRLWYLDIILTLPFFHSLNFIEIPLYITP
jgi:hypothetical protein